MLMPHVWGILVVPHHPILVVLVMYGIGIAPLITVMLHITCYINP